MSSTHTEAPASTGPEHCANCGAALEGPFCGQCGQSTDEIRRPALDLVTSTIGDLFVWDGRFLSTLRALFAGPGRLARAYADGQRARWTPPIRLYLLASLAFFTIVGLAGIRVIAVTASPSLAEVQSQSEERIAERRATLAEDRLSDHPAMVIRRCGVEPGPDEIADNGSLVYAGDTDFSISLLQTGATADPRLLAAGDRDCLASAMTAVGLPPIFGGLVTQAVTDPAGFEARAGAAAGQALILMVIGFALINLALHPRRPVIEHAILSLYLHAALLPAFALILVVATVVGRSTASALGLYAIVQIAQLAVFWISDRHFYGSSWWGALLRLPVQVVAYGVALILAGSMLILLPGL